MHTKSNLKYDGNPKNLLSTLPVAKEGTVLYKLGDNGEYSETPPTARTFYLPNPFIIFLAVSFIAFS